MPFDFCHDACHSLATMSELWTPNNNDGNFVVVVNDGSTSHLRAKAAVGELEIEYGDRVKRVKTERDRNETRKRLVQALNDGPVAGIIIAGGDGTDSTVTEILMMSPDISDELRRTTITSLYGGNGNLGPNQLTPVPYRGVPSLIKILQTAKPVDVHPLVASFKHEDEEQQEIIALYCADIGLGGLTVDKLERRRKIAKSKHKNLNERDNVLAFVSAFKEAPVFSYARFYEDKNGERTERTYDDEQPAYGIFGVNGSRIGQYAHVPTELADPEFFVSILRDKRISRVTSDVAKILFHHPSGEHIKDFGVFSCVIKTKEDFIWGETDGEPHVLRDGTEVKFSRHQKSCRFNTTNPRLLKSAA
jgi:diacylglycerol kinase family enzyme